MALGLNLNFYTSVAKGLKLKVRKFLGLILTFVEVPGEKLVDPPNLNRVKTPIAVDNGVVFKNVKIAVPLKYLSNFWRLVEMPLINCKMYLELNWTKDCVMSNIADTTFKTTSMELYVPIVTLSTKDKVKLTKKLNEGSKRPVYWNKYITKMESKDLNNGNFTTFYLDASFQGVRRLFVLAFDNTDGGDKKLQRNSHRKYFLPRVNITDYNVLIDGRNFLDQPLLSKTVRRN